MSRSDDGNESIALQNQNFSLASSVRMWYHSWRFRNREEDEKADIDDGGRRLWRVGRDGNGRRLHVDVPNQRRHGVLKRPKRGSDEKERNNQCLWSGNQGHEVQ